MSLTDVPESLWSDAPLDKPPAAPPDWIDKLADEVEINRLLSMGRFAKESRLKLGACGNAHNAFRL